MIPNYTLLREAGPSTLISTLARGQSEDKNWNNSLSFLFRLRRKLKMGKKLSSTGTIRITSEAHDIKNH